MTSQKSTQAVPPKRRRGHERVAAILQAATAEFAEKGYDAATMTAIAARSGTAIGSLYRFFPTKQTLSDVLLQRYGEQLGAAVDAVTARAGSLDAGALAAALVALMLERGSERAAAVALVDAFADAAARRQALREDLRGRLAVLLRAAGADDDPTGLGRRATVLLQTLKAVPALAGEADGAALVAETQRLLTLYLADLAGRP